MTTYARTFIHRTVQDSRKLYENQDPKMFAETLSSYILEKDADDAFEKFTLRQIREVMHIVIPAKWKQTRAMILAELYKQLCYKEGTLLEVQMAERVYGNKLPLDNSKEYAATEFKEA